MAKKPKQPKFYERAIKNWPEDGRSREKLFMHTTYDLNKIKFATDEATFKRAVGLYESGKVTEVEQLGGYYSAVLLGTEPYRVSVSARNYKHGHCTCYLGEKDTLCKHMVALALYAVMEGKPLSDKDKQLSHHAECSERRDTLSKEEASDNQESYC